jgi:hypothetical protein
MYFHSSRQMPKCDMSTKVDCSNATSTCHLLPTSFGFRGFEQTTNSHSSSLMIPQTPKCHGMPKWAQRPKECEIDENLERNARSMAFWDFCLTFISTCFTLTDLNAYYIRHMRIISPDLFISPRHKCKYASPSYYINASDFKIQNVFIKTCPFCICVFSCSFD